MLMLERTNVRLDPDVVDYSMVCHRQVQTPYNLHLPTNIPVRMPFTGMLTVGRSPATRRMTAVESVDRSILIASQFRLTQAQPQDVRFPRLDADLGICNARLCGVTIPGPYTRYDTNFLQAHFGLMKSEGGLPID